MPRRRLKKQIEHGSEETALLILLFALVVKTMRLLAASFEALLTFLLMLGAAIDAFLRALPYPLIDRRIRPAYYDISDQRSPRGKITPRMALIVCASMAAVTALSLSYVVMGQPVFIILPPMFAIYVIFVLLRDQYIYARASQETS